MTKLRFGVYAVVITSVFAWIPLSGCTSNESACTDYCGKQSECCMAQTDCNPDDHDVGECVTTCREFSDKDGDYADAVHDQASCFDSSSCSEIQAGECVPEP